MNASDYQQIKSLRNLFAAYRDKAVDPDKVLRCAIELGRIIPEHCNASSSSERSSTVMAALSERDKALVDEVREYCVKLYTDLANLDEEDLTAGE